MKWLYLYILIIIVVITVIPYSIVKWSGYESPEKQRDIRQVKKINVFLAEKEKIEEMPLEYYLLGVVGAEMPAEFPEEALKAQAIAARTYSVYRMMLRQNGKSDEIHPDADICTDHTHCQAWMSKEDLFKRWGILFSAWYWRKIMVSVYETWGEVITYNGDIVNPVFHANSGGKTENAEDVWEGPAVPYLRSVISEGEEIASSFSDRLEMDKNKFISLLKERYPEFRAGSNIIKDITVQSYTEGNRVKEIKIGNIILKGTDVRKIFGLKSTNFRISVENGKIIFETKGYGHGVGMSQWGARVLADRGMKYDEILRYYYTGVEVSKQ